MAEKKYFLYFYKPGEFVVSTPESIKSQPLDIRVGIAKDAINNNSNSEANREDTLKRLNLRPEDIS